MTRDYKPSPKRAPAKSGSPMLTGIIIGMFIGIGIALGVALYLKQSPSPFLDKSKPATAPADKSGEKAAAAEPAQKSAEKPRFDFYTILPGTEEPVTEQEIRQAAQQPAGAPQSLYFLQAGSFQKEADADNLKAKLALMGVEAAIQTATIPDKGVWHRVRVGPYTSLDELNRVRASLSQNGIDASLIKVQNQAGR